MHSLRRTRPCWTAPDPPRSRSEDRCGLCRRPSTLRTEARRAMGRGTGLPSIAGVTGVRAPRSPPTGVGAAHLPSDRSLLAGWQAADQRGALPSGFPQPSAAAARLDLRRGSAEALLLEVGAVCRSTRTPAPFPQARSPFEAFPSFTAVPRRRDRFPLDVCGAGPIPFRTVASTSGCRSVALRPQGFAP